MPIETKIEELTAAINNLCVVLSGKLEGSKVETSEISKEVESTESKPSRKPRKAKEPEAMTDATGNANVSADEVLGLAKVKIAEGHERGAIKKKIVSLGADAISELTQENLNKLYDFLNELVLEESL